MNQHVFELTKTAETVYTQAIETLDRPGSLLSREAAHDLALLVVQAALGRSTGGTP